MNPTTLTWCKPPDNLFLSKQEVHLWKADVEELATTRIASSSVLSSQERQRAKRFLFARDKLRYIIGRSVLRIIISSYYIEKDPKDLKFRYGHHGKPFLDDNFTTGTFYFNQADSHGFVLYAFTVDRKIGVDLEYKRKIKDIEDIVTNNFSEYEKKSFSTLSIIDKNEAFLNCWTRKEAFIKAVGKGLQYPLDRFDVSLSPHEPARLISIGGSLTEASKWILTDIKFHSDYSAALVYEGSIAKIKLYKFSANF